MQRLEFIAQRVLKGVVVLLGIIILNFVLIRMAPGDPATVMAGEAGAADEHFPRAACASSSASTSRFTSSSWST